MLQKHQTLIGTMFCPICNEAMNPNHDELIWGANDKGAHYHCLARSLHKYDILIPSEKPAWINSSMSAYEFFFTLVKIYDTMYQENETKNKQKNLAARLFLSIFKYFAWNYSNVNLDEPMNNSNRHFCLHCGLPASTRDPNGVIGNDAVSHYGCIKAYLHVYGILIPDKCPMLQSETDWRNFFTDLVARFIVNNASQPLQAVSVKIIAFQDIFEKLNWTDIDIMDIFLNNI